MGGHGGLNILPQKRWNVYNFENREKVRKDEEEAAKEEQLKREQARKRDSELRLQQLRRASGVDPATISSSPATPPPDLVESKSESDSKHINLFDGIKIFDPIVLEKKRDNDDHDGDNKRKKMKKEVRVVGPEDEKYRLGYGVAGKGVKAPWYMMKPQIEDEDDEEKDRECTRKGEKSGEKKKKSVEELREERLKREKAEKERERALLIRNGRIDGGSSSSSYQDRYYPDRYYRRNR